MAKIIGLTGGIATGKSTVSTYLRSLGFPVVDADQVAHEVLLKKSVQKALVKQFGRKIVIGKSIDRKKLGKIVFEDSLALQTLNKIMQPKIRRTIFKKIRHLGRNKNVIILDAPILLEQGYQSDVDFIMVVAVDQTTEKARLELRDKLSDKEAIARIEAQMNLEDKKAMADVVVDNSGTIADTELQVLKWLENNNLIVK